MTTETMNKYGIALLMGLVVANAVTVRLIVVYVALS